MCCSGRRHLVARYMRESYPATFQDISFLEDAASAAATFRTIPTVTPKFIAVHLFQASHNHVLQLEQEFFDCGTIHASSDWFRIYLRINYHSPIPVFLESSQTLHRAAAYRKVQAISIFMGLKTATF